MKRIYPQFTFEKELINRLEVCSNHNKLVDGKSLIWKDFFFLENEDGDFDLKNIEDLLESKDRQVVFEGFTILQDTITHYSNILSKFLEENK